MANVALEPLILDLLEWVAKADRTYAEVMEVWRTSCPRLPVWEDANDRGLVAIEEAGGRCLVKVTPLGRAFLRQQTEIQDFRSEFSQPI
jgi:predicted transcriptional regulator